MTPDVLKSSKLAPLRGIASLQVSVQSSSHPDAKARGSLGADCSPQERIRSAFGADGGGWAVAGDDLGFVGEG
jgi:hypothetical protein